MGSGVAAGDAEVDEELGDGLGGHRGAPVGVQGELVAVDAVAVESVGDELFGELAGLGGGDHPADDVAAEDVDDDVQLVVDAPSGPGSLVMSQVHTSFGSSGDQLGLLLAGWVRCRRRSRFSPAWPAAGTWWRSSTGRCRRRAGGPTPGPGPGRSTPRERSTARTCWRSASVSALAGAGRGAGGPSSGRLAAPVVAWPGPEQLARPRWTSPSTRSSKCSSITASASVRCPRSRRGAPRARALFP